MLSVRRNLRRATASLLRRQARHTPIARLIPAHGAARSSLQLRAFSQKNDNSETFMGRLKSTAWDVKVTAIDMIQEARGLELTDYEVTVMLESSAAGKKIDNCIELLRYCEENHVSPWPEARLKAFRVLCDARELEVALQLYESLCKDDMELKPWMVGRALDAATKLNRPEAVLKYFQILIPKNCDVRSGERVGDMFRQVCEQGGEMDEFALRSIAIFADRAGEADLALEVLSLAKKRAGGAPVDMHMSVMTVYGKQERWMELVKLYDEMPKIFCWKLKSDNLGLIIRAHALSGKRGVAARGPEIFKKYVKKKQWGTVTCNAMLEALLHTRQFNELLVIADEMRQKDVEWTSSSYKMVTLAHIETGTAEQAKEILLANADKIDDRGLECYRELVVYHSKVQHQRQLLRGAGQTLVLLASSHYDGQKAMPHGVRSSKTKPISKNGDAYTPKPGVSDVVLARKTFEDIKEQGNSGKRLSNNSALISTMAKHGRISDCIDMLSYFEKQGVTTKLFADRAVFNAFCRADKFERALQVFERLSKAGPLDPWVYGWAMNAATQLDRQEVLAAIFRVLVPEYDTDVTTTDSFQVDTTYDLVYEMLQDACSRGVDLSEPALRSFATFAFKAAHSDLALTVVSISQNGNSSVSREIVEAALTSCCFDSRWSDVIRVFEDTPANLRPNLASDSLGAVMKAYARSGDEFFALELFENHKAKWGKFACNIALDVLLETDQADAALTLAKDMKRHGVKWNSRTYTAVALAYIRSGLLDEARVFLSDNAKLLQNCSYGAYRELIECYMNARGDNLTACQLIVDLIENNKEVEFSDWQDALQLADLEDKIPSHLMLTERESPVGRGFRAESSSVAHHIPLMPAEVSLALEVFDDIWNADGSGLTRNTATKLLTTMIKHKHISDCVEMVDYFKERRVLPKPFACAAAFNLLCDAKEDDLALQLFEGMLQDGMFLSGGDCIRALNVAMKLDNHELASSIGDYMKENVMHADERQAH
uniref:Pentacotripeptide-repeat region of PRORP domain-containing protein n=1 Tax=Phytophthora fragariae TaxID=53985 RepID=A0A6A3DZ11_9STRA|nr:hypothetical protein PF009_g24242 [Phytophthora fragariae]